DFGELDELTLAYACTIHKSQGSEYPAVIVPLHTQHFIMLQRNLLYTGITRGKRLVIVIGSRRALERAVRQADSRERCSLLRGRLPGRISSTNLEDVCLAEPARHALAPRCAACRHVRHDSV